MATKATRNVNEAKEAYIKHCQQSDWYNRAAEIARRFGIEIVERTKVRYPAAHYEQLENTHGTAFVAKNLAIEKYPNPSK